MLRELGFTKTAGLPSRIIKQLPKKDYKYWKSGFNMRDDMTAVLKPHIKSTKDLNRTLAHFRGKEVAREINLAKAWPPGGHEGLAWQQADDISRALSSGRRAKSKSISGIHEKANYLEKGSPLPEILKRLGLK